MIGERLVLARKSAGLSLRDLAVTMGNIVSFQAIQKYESDEAMPTSPVLRALSRALGVSERYLLNPRQIEITGIEFHSARFAGAKEEGAAKAQLLTAVERYIEVEALVPGTESEWVLPQNFPFPIIKKADAELAADRLRSAWGLGNQVISQLPEVLEERGIKIIPLKLNPKIPAILCSVKRGNQPDIHVIVINNDNPGERQQFGLAQELARLILDFEAVRENIDAICERFARAFLMIHDAFIAAVGKARQHLPMGELLRLKALFGVAVVQIVNRCIDLEIISVDERRRLFECFASAGWMKPPFEEADRVEAKKPSRFERLCLRALAEEMASESRIAELLGVSTIELGSIADSVWGVVA